MTQPAQRYEGQAELELLEGAARYNRHIASRFAAALPAGAQPEPRVLDFGAGLGTITREFAALTGVRPAAVEPDPGQRERLEARGFECRAAIEQFPEASFDLVISSNVLEHIPDDVGTLRRLATRLRKGGRMACWVPAFPLLWTALDDRVGHVRRYRAHDLSAAFEQAGFAVESVRHEDSLGFAAALAFRLVGNRSGTIDRRSLWIYDTFVFPVSRALDRVTWPLFGKNLFLIAERR